MESFGVHEAGALEAMLMLGKLKNKTNQWARGVEEENETSWKSTVTCTWFVHVSAVGVTASVNQL